MIFFQISGTPFDKLRANGSCLELRFLCLSSLTLFVVSLSNHKL